MSSNATRMGRLRREMEMMAKKPTPGVYLGPVNDSMEEFEATITGVEGTPYESGVFKLEIKIPERYPYAPPSVRFVTKVYHPNIDDGGRICLQTLKTKEGDWTPMNSLVKIVAEIRMLLKNPNPNDSLMPEIAQLYIMDRDRYNKEAEMMTAKYASAASEKDPVAKSSKSKSEDN